MEYKATNILSPLKTTGTDQTPIEDDIQVLGFIIYFLPEKKRQNVKYLHNNDVKMSK